MPVVHFRGEHLPGMREAADTLFHFGFSAGLGQGLQAGLTVGAILGGTAVALVAVFILVRRR